MQEEGNKRKGEGEETGWKNVFLPVILNFIFSLSFAPLFSSSLSVVLCSSSICLWLQSWFISTYSWPDGGANTSCPQPKRRNLKVFVLFCYFSSCRSRLPPFVKLIKKVLSDLQSQNYYRTMKLWVLFVVKTVIFASFLKTEQNVDNKPGPGECFQVSLCQCGSGSWSGL